LSVGGLLISDGWTSVSSRPILIALLATLAGSLFLEAVDTSGEVKDKEFIAAFMIRIIKKVGEEFVVAVCMDGACMAFFPIITEEVHHIFCYICPTHSFDKFLKNVCSNCSKGLRKGWGL
jgi:hypothetical protein